MEEANMMVREEYDCGRLAVQDLGEVRGVEGVLMARRAH